MPKGFAPGCRSLLKLLDPKLPFELFPLQSKFSELLPSVTESPPLVLLLLFLHRARCSAPPACSSQVIGAFFPLFLPENQLLALRAEQGQQGLGSQSRF